MTLADFADECGIEIDYANEWLRAGIIVREEGAYSYRLTRPVLLILRPDGTREAVCDAEGLPVCAEASCATTSARQLKPSGSDREQEEYLLSLSGANIIRLALGFQPKKHGGKRDKGGFQPGNTLSPRHPKNKKQDG